MIKGMLLKSKCAFKFMPLLFIVVVISSMLRSVLAFTFEKSIDSAITKDGKGVILYVIAGLALVAFVNLCTYFRSIIGRRASEKISIGLRQELLNKIFNMDYRAFEGIDQGRLSTTLNDDIDKMSTFLPVSMREFCFGVFQTLFGVIYGFSVSIELTIIAVVFVSVGVLLSEAFSKKIFEISNSKQQEEDKIRSFIQDRLQNKTVTKMFSLEKLHTSKFLDICRAKIKKVTQLERTSAFLKCISGIASQLALVGIMLIGVYFVTINKISIGQLVGVLNIISVVFWPFYFLPGFVVDINAQKASLERIALIKETNFTDVKRDKNILIKSITAENISFSYDNQEALINNVSFEARLGEIVGITGESGCGKSTLLKLLLTLYRPDSGEIFVTGNNHELVSGINIRSYIAYVPQINVLFSKSILDNILDGNESASLNEVKAAAKLAHADEFISALPEGYNTVLYENGAGLSEGQRQRIAIARALLKNAPILIMDEASSALDSISEMHIIEALKNISLNSIIILVAHNPQMQSICTTIYDMNK